MRPRTTATAAALVAGAAAAAVALASGGPPPPAAEDPPPYTVTATGAAQHRVARPRRQTNATVERAVRAARAAAVGAAVRAARQEAGVLARAAGLALGAPVAIRRDMPPAGWYDQDAGRFGFGRWCGRMPAGRRTVRGSDGRLHRVTRYRRGCSVPRTAAIRVTMTFAARR